MQDTKQTTKLPEQTKTVYVEWETDNENPDLPDKVEVPLSIIGNYKEVPDDPMYITDYISDKYGWLIKSISI